MIHPGPIIIVEDGNVARAYIGGQVVAYVHGPFHHSKYRLWACNLGPTWVRGTYEDAITALTKRAEKALVKSIAIHLANT